MPGAYFYGFKIGGGLADNVLKTILVHKDKVPRATWTDESKLHITMKFIGKTLPANADEQLARACFEFKPFIMTLCGVGTFNNKSGPRVLYATPSPLSSEHLANLHTSLGGNSDSFTAHLTLAKLEDIGDAAPEFAHLQRELHGVDFGKMLVDEVALYQTQGSGKPYKVVAWHRLLG